jgi:methyl-accepting chemotaxis protein
MGVVNIKDYRWMNEDTKSIVDAINHNGNQQSEKIEGMQKSVSELAKSVHELATSNNYLSKDVETIQIDIKEINKRLNKVEPAAENMKKISDIFLKWVIPILLFGSFVSYTVLKA